MEPGKDTKISQAITVTNGAAGTSDINGSVLDMSGVEGVLIAIQLGAIVSGAATSLRVQQGDAADGSGMDDLEGTNQTILDTDDEDTLYVDLKKPVKRYIRLVFKRATQDSTVSAVYFQYGARKMPTTHGSNVSGETHVSPDEGTA